MPFMQKQITPRQQWLSVEGNCGTEFIPANLINLSPDGPNPMPFNRVATGSNDAEFNALWEAIEDYVEARKADVYEIAIVSGYGARLSAPGFMDCTLWGVYENEEAAREALEEMYPDDTDERA